jgi:phage terminase large subunit-like protein
LAQTVKTIKGEPISQRFYVDLNPTTRQHWTYRLWIDGVDPETQAGVDQAQFGSVVVNPFDNVANLSQEYLNDLRALPDRARKRFLEGKYVEDVEDALWRRAMFKRVKSLPPLTRVVVAIDPAVTNEPGSDETGIIAAGMDAAGNGYVLDDASGRFRPEEWARMALAVYDVVQGDRIVAETNQGGDMVEATIRAIRSNVPYRGVRASRGKVARAEPIAALYERGKIFHAGEFEALEDQLCSLTTGFDARAAGWSPDRVDALVWALTDLFDGMTAPRAEDDNLQDMDDRGINATTGY